MTFPTAQISTANLDSASDSPASARSDLLQTVQTLNTIVAEANSAGGVALLDGSGLYSATKMPTSITASGVQVINPTGSVVNVRDFLRITVQSTADIKLFATPAQGDIAYSSDGDAGSSCLCVYDGAEWRVIRFGTSIGDAPAALSSEFTVYCDAEVV